MPNGDIAAARGWTTFASTQNRSQGYDNDNYSLDRAAEQANRLDVVEAAVSQPIFSVRRSSANIWSNANNWTTQGGGSYATPTLNTGFTSWSGGQLTIKLAGVYRITAHVQWSGWKYSSEIQVTTGTVPDAAGKVQVKNGNAGVGCTATGLARLVAGDTLMLHLLARITADSTDQSAVAGSADSLTWDVEWVRA